MTQHFLDVIENAPAQGFEPSRAVALDRLNGFVAKAGSLYARQRNFDFGPGKHSKVSGLSPWIRHRVLLEEDVISAVFADHDLQAAEKFIQEVFWRGYFKGWLEHRPEVWRYYKQDVVTLFDELEKHAGRAKAYEDAVSGRTGIEGFDAWARELIETGYLHNHARMWFASIWIFTLKLPWQLGADFFYRHLLDGDPASNTCSWRWVGGLHTVGKTYLARASNIEKFTAGRFNPTGQLAAEAPALGDPRPITMTAPRFPDPDLAGRRIGLIVTEEDCHPESLDIPSPAAVVALRDATLRSVRPLGAIAGAFAPAAVQDAGARAEHLFDAPVTVQSEPDWAALLKDWAGVHGLDAVVTARLPLGPVQKRLRQACRSADLELIEVTRPYDQAVWQNAKKGFFGLKKKIPAILRTLGH
ncbi:MAG: FAD-binding domain-containing protein [Pseudomonadota bacterium]